MNKGRKSLFACGDNAYGELGLGHNEEVTVPTEIATPAGGKGLYIN